MTVKKVSQRKPIAPIWYIFGTKYDKDRNEEVNENGHFHTFKILWCNLFNLDEEGEEGNYKL